VDRKLELKKLKLLSKKRMLLEKEHAFLMKKFHVELKKIDKECNKIYCKLSDAEKDLICKKIPEEEKVLEIIKKELEFLDMVSHEQILELAKKQGLTSKKIIQSLDNLQNRGLLYRPRHGFYKTI